MCNIHIQESKWLVFATPSYVLNAYTELKKGLNRSKLESLKGEWKEDRLPLMMQGIVTVWMHSRAMR